MSFLSRWRDQWIEHTDALREQPERRSLQFPTQDLLDAFSATKGYAGQSVTAQKALGLGPVWGAVSTIAEQIGQLPLKVYRDLGDGEKVEARQHRMWRVLHDKPNSYTPADRFWSAVATHLLLWGNAYIRKVRGADGVVEELWLIHPSEVVIRWDSVNRVKQWFWQPSNAPGQRRVELFDRDLVHIWGLSCNGVWGDSVVSYCKNTLGTALARDEFEGGFYARGATVRGVIQHPARIGKDGLKNLRDSFNVIYGGSGQSHQTAALEEGAQFVRMADPLGDLQFVESKGLSATEIATMFRLPPNYLGGSTGGSLTYSTVEMNQLDLNQRAVSPWANTIAKALSNDPGVLPQGVLSCEFVLEATLRADAKARAEFYETLFNLQDSEGRRALSVDEIRALENRGAAEKEDVPAPPPALPQADGNGNGQLPRGALDAVVSAEK